MESAIRYLHKLFTLYSIAERPLPRRCVSSLPLAAPRIPHQDRVEIRNSILRGSRRTFRVALCRDKNGVEKNIYIYIAI